MTQKYYDLLLPGPNTISSAGNVGQNEDVRRRKENRTREEQGRYTQTILCLYLIKLVYT